MKIIVMLMSTKTWELTAFDILKEERYQAWCEDSPDKQGFGESADEAIGNLIAKTPEYFGLKVHSQTNVTAA